MALLYGPIVGGAVGLLTELILTIVNISTSSYLLSITSFMMYIFDILFFGLYGFTIGKIFESKAINKDSKDAVISIGFFSLLTTGLYIIIDTIPYIVKFGIIFRFFSITISTILRILLDSLISGLIICAISFLIVFICHKCLNINIPIYAKEKKTSVKSEESTSYSDQHETLPSETLPESKTNGGSKIVKAKSSRSRVAAALLCFFFGLLGIHRFYVGKIGTGLLWLFTGGLGGIGVLVDFIVILVGGFKDKEGYKV